MLQELVSFTNNEKQKTVSENILVSNVTFWQENLAKLLRETLHAFKFF